MTKAKIVFALLIMFLVSCSSTKSTSSADGSSVQNAFKVKSVDEEYQIIRKVCEDCKVTSQALITEKKKYYDVLYVTKPNGEQASYYFDINSFFGQW